MPGRDKLAECVQWCAAHVTGDEKGQAQIFLDHGSHQHTWTPLPEWEIRHQRQHRLRVEST